MKKLNLPLLFLLIHGKNSAVHMKAYLLPSRERLAWLCNFFLGFGFTFSLVPIWGIDVAASLMFVVLSVEISRSLVDVQWGNIYSSDISSGRKANIVILLLEQASCCVVLYIIYRTFYDSGIFWCIAISELASVYCRGLIFSFKRSESDERFYFVDLYLNVSRRVVFVAGMYYCLVPVVYAIGITFYAFFSYLDKYSWRLGDGVRIFIKSIPSAIFTMPVKFGDQVLVREFGDSNFIFYRLLKSVVGVFVQLVSLLDFSKYSSNISKPSFSRGVNWSLIFIVLLAVSLASLWTYCYIFNLTFDTFMAFFMAACFLIYQEISFNLHIVMRVSLPVYYRIRLYVGVVGTVAIFYFIALGDVYTAILIGVFFWLVAVSLISRLACSFWSKYG